ncbi:MAG: DNA-directed RNA polymerase subunit alpha [Candidatus Yanofskybacteria bacterium RIFCSPHIGHO2_02_FULL_43_15c]|uniref:DNA-directed RNA polymerase subunit alpha n=2 Tax=Candidatus Yanofskyibacteriota TaxID=1752733 RepID=A0A1F8H525_9BACT|nr:MAG: DNA-directed RNA polymerase subunit alpha [Candidatus Yanofskybacteria bacterium RIFCSPHIGHO2_02_FULL_43_15c]OGN32330.1 MAG: DNA-directed RNA polymerase subunit alpha [Candidatus Yanofskybacteria bacterium RIFCSPLOWO2_02_FULL_43_10b]
MVQLPEKLSVLKEEGHKMTLELSPLYPGYGVTVGNALRRVLLSSIEGAAITSVKIKGVSHEFSTMEGVLENVIEIIMNVKKIRLKLFGDEPATLELKVSGEKEVKAKDIKTHQNVEIVTKDQLIATLTSKKAELEMELTVEKGIGYVPIEQRQKEKISVGTIAVDALFSPVKNVNFTVENIRVGQRTDYNKLILEIETDGLISPREALKKSLEIIAKHLEIIEKELGHEIKEETETAAEELAEEEKTVKKTKKKKIK